MKIDCYVEKKFLYNNNFKLKLYMFRSEVIGVSVDQCRSIFAKNTPITICDKRFTKNILT